MEQYSEFYSKKAVVFENDRFFDEIDKKRHSEVAKINIANIVFGGTGNPSPTALRRPFYKSNAARASGNGASERRKMPFMCAMAMP